MTNLELGQEYIPPNEEEATREIIKIEEEILGTQPPVQRAEHGKGHGCMRGEFIIDPNLPEDDKIRVGVFQEPGKRFHACIRFSNFSVQHDFKGDAHGMAIKLMGVPGEKILEDEKYEETQDFLFIDQPVFLIRNAKDYAEVFREIGRIKNRNPLKFFFPSLNPFQWRWRELQIALAVRTKKLSSPLATQYWSSTPYKLGSNAIKFAVKPYPDNLSFESKFIPKTKDYLSEALKLHLQKHGACFDFLIQFQTNPNRMPVEDPTVEWTSPFYKVATLNIPPQTIDSPEQVQFCENLSFTPWHSLPEHRPLGGINRPRKQIYEELAKLRQKLNGVPRREPTPEEFLSIFQVNNDENSSTS
jgi:hypothetical protein